MEPKDPIIEAETKASREEALIRLENKSHRQLVKIILGKDTDTGRKFADNCASFADYEPTNEDDIKIRAVWELAKRFAGKKCGIYLKPRDIWETLIDVRDQKKEHFMVFLLDTRNQEIKRFTVSIGTLNYNLVHPREVFEPAVKNLAASIIVAHNHPSGCLEPSDEDLSLTKRLTQAGKLLGIEVLDHVIVSKDGFMSFKQKGLI